MTDQSAKEVEDVGKTAFEGCKVVIFSQFNKMLNLLEKSFNENKLGVKYTRIDGSFNKDKRQKRMNEFKNDPECRVLMAT